MASLPARHGNQQAVGDSDGGIMGTWTTPGRDTNVTRLRGTLALWSSSYVMIDDLDHHL